MAINAKSIRVIVPRLLVVIALLGCPTIGSAAGTWSSISLPLEPGDVLNPRAAAVDVAGNLYVADNNTGTWDPNIIQKRDAQGSWSVIASHGRALGQVDTPIALAVDAAGSLYVSDGRIQKRDAQGNWSILDASHSGALAVDTAGDLFVAGDGIQKRDAQGNWSVIATAGSGTGQVNGPNALAVDSAGNLYVTDSGNGRIQKRDGQGHWYVIATVGQALGQVWGPSALAAGGAGNLYVAGSSYLDAAGQTRIQKRDAQGNWSVIATFGPDLGQVVYTSALAVDTADNLYVADERLEGYHSPSRIQKRDALGNWSIVASGTAPGSVSGPSGVAADAAGNVYVADVGFDDAGRIQKRDTHGNWSVIASYGSDVGQVFDPTALAMDTAGDLYVAESSYDISAASHIIGRLRKRDAQGNWSVIATEGDAPGQVDFSFDAALAVDTAGNLYVADSGNGRIQKRDTQGNWSVIAANGSALGQVGLPTALAVDAAGDLYVADRAADGDRIEKRDAQGSWSVIAATDTTQGIDLGQIYGPHALAADSAGNLYVAEFYIDFDEVPHSRIQKRDAQGNWSVIATYGADPGQVFNPSGLTVDGIGNLYVADTGNDRVQEYTPSPEGEIAT